MIVKIKYSHWTDWIYLIFHCVVLLLMLAMSVLQVCSFFVEELLGAYNSEIAHIIAASATVIGTAFVWWIFIKCIIEIKITRQ